MEVEASVIAKKDNVTPGYAWVILVVVFVASVAAPLNQFKVPPVMPILIDLFNLNMTYAGLLMGVFSIAGFLLALPAGLILQRIGSKWTGIISVGCVTIGALLGTFAASSGMLLASRTIEGVGMAVIGVMAPMVLTMWFPPEKHGIVLGIWSTWVSVGLITMMNVAPTLTASYGWQSSWWFGTGFGAFALLIFWMLFRMPDKPIAVINPDPESGKRAPLERPPTLGRAMANRNIWLVGFMLLCFNIMILAENSFMPTFLVKVRGFTMQQAGFVTSLVNIVMLASCPLGGWLSDRIGSRKFVYTICFVVLGFMWALPFTLPRSLIPMFMIAFGIFAGPLPATIVASVPEVVKRPELIGFGMAINMLCHHFGEFVGPIMFGRVVDATNSWATAGYVLIPICWIGALSGWLAKVR